LTPDPAPIPLAPASPVAEEFARQIAPKLQAQLGEHKVEIVASAGFGVGLALKAAWGAILRLVPSLTASVVDAVFDRFGGMSLSDVLARLIEHNRAKGHSTHPSVAAAAGRIE
jgi:hypothetical protein